MHITGPLRFNQSPSCKGTFDFASIPKTGQDQIITGPYNYNSVFLLINFTRIYNVEAKAIDCCNLTCQFI